MVSPSPISSAASAAKTSAVSQTSVLDKDPLHCDDAPYVEQHFPRQMSWYAPEGPTGALESTSRWVRENPWPALGIAAASGILLALITGPAARGTAASAKALFHTCDCKDDEE
jgi:hypothetical protein